MAAMTIIRTRPNNKPGRKIQHIVASWNSTDTTGTLQVPKGNIVSVRGISSGTATLEYSACSDAQGNGFISPTLSSGNSFINMTRSSGGSATVHHIDVEYDSQ